MNFLHKKYKQMLCIFLYNKDVNFYIKNKKRCLKKKKEIRYFLSTMISKRFEMV